MVGRPRDGPERTLTEPTRWKALPTPVRVARHTERVDAWRSGYLLASRGVVRLLNTAGGRALCLAGEVDEGVVEAHLRRYGREPMPVDVIDTGSVTRLSPPALDLVLDHLGAAERAGRPVVVRR